MIKKRRSLLAIVMVIVMMLSQVAVFAEEAYVLEIGGEGLETELKLTIEDLKAVPKEAQIDEDYIYNSKKGEQTVGVKGVNLAYLLNEKAGLKLETGEVKFQASDD